VREQESEQKLGNDAITNVRTFLDNRKNYVSNYYDKMLALVVI
jgi:hypothetical protein